MAELIRMEQRAGKFDYQYSPSKEYSCFLYNTRREMKGIEGAPTICHTPFRKQDPKMVGLVTSPKQKDFGQMGKQKDFIGQTEA